VSAPSEVTDATFILLLVIGTALAFDFTSGSMTPATP
jgi:hypothetical protein